MNLIRLCKIDSNVMVYLLDISWKFQNYFFLI